MTGRMPRVLTAALVAVVSVLLLTVPVTRGTLTGSVRNGANTVADGVYASCTTAAATVGDALFVHPLDEPTGATALDVTGNGRPGTYYGGYTLNQAGPCPARSGRSVLLDGSSGFVGNPVAQTNPQVFSVQVWFRTTTTNAGRLIGFGNRTGTTISTQYDRMIYLTTNGKLTFGVFPGAIRTVTSPLSYNDGAWHHAVATLGTNGMRLYVDGVDVARDTATTSAQVYDGPGYWRVGWDNLATWPNALLSTFGALLGPTNYYLAGNVAYAAVFAKTLTAAQVSSLYAARG